jgi:hypothetical protein
LSQIDSVLEDDCPHDLVATFTMGDDESLHGDVENRAQSGTFPPGVNLEAELNIPMGLDANPRVDPRNIKFLYIILSDSVVLWCCLSDALQNPQNTVNYGYQR